MVMLNKSLMLSLILMCALHYHSELHTIHSNLNHSDKQLIQQSFSANQIRILVILWECIWEYCHESGLAVIMDTQFYDAHEHCFIDYPIADIVCMLHFASACHLFCPTCMQSFYTHVLFEPLA